jgi:hypothetical protein
MKYPIKELQKQLDRLQMVRKRLYPGRGHLVWIVSLNEMTHNDPRGHRIVEDQYEDAEGKLVMTMERLTLEPSDIGKCFPFKYWNRTALKVFREHEEYGRHHAPKVPELTWRRCVPRVGGKDGRLLPSSEQPYPFRNHQDQG